MATKAKPFPIPLGSDEKSTPAMVYTQSFIFWGEVVTKAMVRANLWLRTNSAPDNLCLYNALALLPGLPGPLKPVSYPEVHIPLQHVICYHTLPPFNEPLDYDPNEANRKMEPVTCMVGEFRLDGFLRLSAQSTLTKHFEVTREIFAPVYDVHVSHPGMAEMKLPKIPYVLVRQATAVFAARLVS